MEPQTTNLYQEHTNQLPPDIIGSSHWLRRKAGYTDHRHRQKDGQNKWPANHLAWTKGKPKRREPIKITPAKLKRCDELAKVRQGPFQFFSQII